jgi:tRNA G26 N,N-dimethylase Trm1
LSPVRTLLIEARSLERSKIKVVESKEELMLALVCEGCGEIGGLKLGPFGNVECPACGKNTLYAGNGPTFVEVTKEMIGGKENG